MYVRLSRAWYYVPDEDGIQLWRFADRKRLRVRGPRDALLEAARVLANGVQVSAASSVVARAAGWPVSHAEQLIRALFAAGVLLRESQLDPPVPKEPERNLYDPQIEYFSRWEREGLSGADMNAKLQDRKIVVIGLGGYGSWLMMLLARMGVRHLVGIDKDCVELSNLSRQVLYSRDDIGRTKVIGARDYVRAIDPSIEVEAHCVDIQCTSDLAPLIEGADLVLIPFGYAPSNRPPMARACAERGIPFLVSGLYGVGPLCVPGQTPCHHCVISRNPAMIEASRPLRQYRWALPASAFAPEMGFSAAFTVMEASRFLSRNQRPRTLGGMYQIDSRDYTISFEPGQRSFDCDICGDVGGAGDGRGIPA